MFWSTVFRKWRSKRDWACVFRTGERAPRTPNPLLHELVRAMDLPRVGLERTPAGAARSSLARQDARGGGTPSDRRARRNAGVLVLASGRIYAGGSQPARAIGRRRARPDRMGRTDPGLCRGQDAHFSRSWAPGSCGLL